MRVEIRIPNLAGAGALCEYARQRLLSSLSHELRHVEALIVSLTPIRVMGSAAMRCRMVARLSPSVHMAVQETPSRRHRRRLGTPRVRPRRKGTARGAGRREETETLGYGRGRGQGRSRLAPAGPPAGAGAGVRASPSYMARSCCWRGPAWLSAPASSGRRSTRLSSWASRCSAFCRADSSWVFSRRARPSSSPAGGDGGRAAGCGPPSAHRRADGIGLLARHRHDGLPAGVRGANISLRAARVRARTAGCLSRRSAEMA